MTDPKTVTVQERLREVVTLLQDVQEASEAPQQLKLAIALGNIDAVLEAQSERSSMEGEIERLSESLFILSDRLRASGILSASDAVHEAYEKVVADFSALTSSKTEDETK